MQLNYGICDFRNLCLRLALHVFNSTFWHFDVYICLVCVCVFESELCNTAIVDYVVIGHLDCTNSDLSYRVVEFSHTMLNITSNSMTTRYVAVTFGWHYVITNHLMSDEINYYYPCAWLFLFVFIFPFVLFLLENLSMSTSWRRCVYQIWCQYSGSK